jgi:hypothetical protein
MIMAPGIDGLETYRRILETNLQQKAILVSDFFADRAGDESSEAGRRHLCEKT